MCMGVYRDSKTHVYDTVLVLVFCRTVRVPCTMLLKRDTRKWWRNYWLLVPTLMLEIGYVCPVVSPQSCMRWCWRARVWRCKSPLYAHDCYSVCSHKRLVLMNVRVGFTDTPPSDTDSRSSPCARQRHALAEIQHSRKHPSCVCHVLDETP